LSEGEDTIVPTVEFPPVMQFTCQETAVLVEVVALLNATEALNDAVSLIPTEVEPGVTLIDVIVAVVVPPPPQESCATIPANAAMASNVRFQNGLGIMFFAIVL